MSGIRTALISRTARLYHWLMPGTCLVCRKHCPAEHYLCPGCSAELPPVRICCQQCGLPLPPQESGRCGQCLSSPPPFTRCVTAYSYAHPVSGLVQGFKDRRQLVAGRFLTAELLYHIRESYRQAPLPDLILPVPLHPSRMRKRGFNQSLEICRWLARELPVLANYNSLYCLKKTGSQKALSLEARKRNLVNAFGLSATAGTTLAGKTVALVDDVITTASTVSVLSRLLSAAGVTEVHVWALARTDRH